MTTKPTVTIKVALDNTHSHRDVQAAVTELVERMELNINVIREDESLHRGVPTRKNINKVIGVTIKGWSVTK